MCVCVFVGVCVSVHVIRRGDGSPTHPIKAPVIARDQKQSVKSN